MGRGAIATRPPVRPRAALGASTVLLAYLICGGVRAEEPHALIEPALAAALEAASAIGEPAYRARALAGVLAASEPGSAGRERARREAERAIGEVSHRALRDAALVDLAIAQAATPDSALDTAGRIAEESLRARTILQLLQARIAERDLPGAEEVASAIPASSSPRALRMLASAYAERGEIDAALDRARRIGPGETFELALAEIAGRLALAGDLRQAQSYAGRIRRAERRDLAHARIASARADAGDEAGALAAAALIEDRTYAALASSRLARLYARRGEQGRSAERFGEALAAARGLRDPRRRALALMDIATDQVASAERAATSATLVEAAEAIAAVRARAEGNALRAALARLLARSGNYPAAMEAARQLDDRAERALVLRDVASEQAASGDGAGAIATAAALGSPETTGPALLGVAATARRLGDSTLAARALDDARAAARGIDDPVFRAQVLGGVAAAHWRSGEAGAARAAFDEALAGASRVADPADRAAAHVEAARAIREGL